MSLEPARHNFTIWQGATFRTVLTLYTGVDETSDPRDLTDYTALLEIRAMAGDVSPLFTLSTTNGRILLGGAEGTVTLLISDTDTAAITWKRGVYDLTITAPLGGDTDVLLWGNFGVRGV